MTREQALKVIDLNIGRLSGSMQEAIKTIVHTLPSEPNGELAEEIGLELMWWTKAKDLLKGRIKDLVDEYFPEDEGDGMTEEDFKQCLNKCARYALGLGYLLRPTIPSVGDERNKIEAVKKVLTRRWGIVRTLRITNDKERKAYYEGKAEGYTQAVDLLNSTLDPILIELNEND